MYFQNIKSINNINFTAREIDIISCILNMRGIKKIAVILSISARTVEGHIQNITLKIGCNSQEGIKDFVERSEYLLLIKRHYLHLLINDLFIQTLRKILALIRNHSVTCCIIDEVKLHDISLLIKHLRMAGIKIIEQHQDLSKDKLRILHIVSKNNMPQILSEDIMLGRNILLSFDIEVNPHLSEAIDDIDIIYCAEGDQYYYAIFRVLGRLLPGTDLSNIIEDFKKVSNNITQFKTDVAVVAPLLSEYSNAPTLSLTQSVLQKFQSTNKILLVCYICICLMIIGFVDILLKRKFLPHLDTLGTINNIKQVSSNLALPHDGILLERTANIAKIDASFKKNAHNVQTVVIVGPGGAGKTTLARQYVRMQNNAVIWEVNGETTGSLISSFEQLAYSLCATFKDKQELNVIQDAEDIDKRNKKTLLFVQTRLKEHPDWLMIYDNVDTFKDIQEYFPYDAKAWGSGRVIITTRDSNIINNSYIMSDNVIPIGELSQEEKFQLFTNVVNDLHGGNKATSDKATILQFLEYIPSFPLDVTSAAYYIKETGISYDKYLKLITTPSDSFSFIQENILKEVGQYSKTRYAIITLSLKRLMGKHPCYQDLLIFISLLNSQNIPRDLLDNFQDRNLVTNFIKELKKISFVTDVSFTETNKIFTFSIHRSTQSVILAYLVKSLNLDQNQNHVNAIAETLDKYMNRELVQYYPEEIKLFISHAEAFLSHSQILTEMVQTNISTQLSRYYFYLGDFNKSQDISARNLDIYERLYGSNRPEIVGILVLIGDIHREMGNYQKAREFLERGYTICKSHYGTQNIQTIKVKLHLAIVHKHMGLYAKAKEALQTTLSVYSKYYGPDHIKIAWPLVNMAAVYKHIGCFQEALEPLERGQNIYKKNLGDDHIKVAWTNVILGDVYKNIGSYLKAQEVIEQGYSIYRHHYGDDHIKVAWTIANLAEVYKDLKNYSKAAEMLENAKMVYKKHYGAEHHKTARVIRDLGVVYLEGGDLKRAESLFAESLEIVKKASHPDQFRCLELLAELSILKSTESDDAEQRALYAQEALAHLTRTLQLAQKFLPSDSPHITRITSKLSKLTLSVSI